MSINQAVKDLQVRLKGKWINFYKDNQELLKQLKIRSTEWHSTDEEETRYWLLPQSDFILGVMLALDSQLKDDLALLSSLNTDKDDLVRTLGLSFDIESEIEKLSNTDKAQEMASELDDIREQIRQNSEELT